MRVSRLFSCHPTVIFTFAASFSVPFSTWNSVMFDGSGYVHHGKLHGRHCAGNRVTVERKPLRQTAFHFFQRPPDRNGQSADIDRIHPEQQASGGSVKRRCNIQQHAKTLAVPENRNIKVGIAARSICDGDGL